jgi:hypothetical protein
VYFEFPTQRARGAARWPENKPAAIVNVDRDTLARRKGEYASRRAHRSRTAQQPVIGIVDRPVEVVARLAARAQPQRHRNVVGVLSIAKHFLENPATDARARSDPTRMASASQLRTLNRLRAEALGDLAGGIDDSLSPDRWGRGGPYPTAEALDRVAQIAKRKYCRPHARPFRLRFARVVAVFPVCSPATL